VNLDGNDVAALVDAAAKAGRQQAVADMRKDVSTAAPLNQPLQDGDVPPEDAPERVTLPELNLNDPITRFERQTLEVLVQLPSAFTGEQLIKLCKAGMSAPAHNAVLKAIQESAADQTSSSWLNSIASNCDPRLHQVLREIAAQTLPAADAEGLAKYGQGVIARAITNAIAREKADLLAELRRVEPGSAESAEVQRKLMTLESERRAL
jgi:DNA primase